MLHSFSNNDLFRNQFHFSLIDSINQNSRDNNNNDHLISSSNLDLAELNNNISNAIQIYNDELSKITKINDTMDNLNRKHNKIVNYLNDFNDNVSAFEDFFKKHFNEKDDNNELILKDIDNINIQINKCKKNIESYIDTIYQENCVDYNKSSNKLKELNNIFTLVKINNRVCPICLQKESTHFTIPCGHLYCNDCSKKLTINCFICRQNILKVNPLYYNN